VSPSYNWRNNHGLADMFHVERLLAVETNMSPSHHKCCDGKQPFHPAMFVSSTRDGSPNGTALNIVKMIQAKLCHESLIFQTGAKPEEPLTI